MRVEPTSPGLRRLEWTLCAVGVGCLAWYGFVAADAWFYQRTQRAALEQTRPVSPPAASVVGPVAVPSPPRVGDPIGFLEIPRLHVSVTAVEGDDDETLRVAVGHLPDTPMPWEPGNSGFAGHRDTFLRPLKNIQVDDEVRVITPRGDFLYRVRRLLIVRPEDVWVLDPTPRSSLTLVTCYPFSFVGHAPQRFIVQADLVDQPID